MKINLPAMIQHRHITRIYSIILGYSIWFCIAQHQVISQTYQAPIYFYDIKTEYVIAPTSIEITVQGNRKEVYKFKKEHAEIHLDGSKFKEGNQEIVLGKENLFLPDTLKLVDLVPGHISIHVDYNKKI
ncbi:hypothetical protein HYV10_04020 [Candidatus Dependentiae bacterium]|nr:hypothetical protein [Candidatus Dependentiae bacterium]